MTINQVRFLGASVESFSASVGWGGGASALNVTLVEDTANGDSFTPLLEGTPVYFDFNGWKFGGLLQSYKYSESTRGKLYNCVINDPRDILSGCTMIINDYSGSTFNVPNLFNPYGYLETLNGFGAAGVNDAGMPWQNVVAGMNGILASSNISYRGYDFSVDLTALPSIPSYYRIAGDSISILDFVTDVCAAGMHDFFFTLTEGNVITLKTISRVNQPQRGRISAFISNVEGASVKEFGYEDRKDVNSKFVVGANVSQVYIQEMQAGAVAPQVANIEPFWGYDNNGRIIFGDRDFNSDQTTHDDCRIRLDSRLVNVNGVHDTYLTNMQEFRAALVGQHSWESLMMANNEAAGTPQFARATEVGLIGNLRKNLFALLQNQGLNNVNKVQLQGWQKDFRNKSEEELNNAQRLFDAISTYAQEYYGRKFMVRIPFVAGKIDAETNIVQLSQTPENDGFVSEDVWVNAIQNNILPLDVDRLTTENDRIVSYVRFDDAQRQRQLDANGDPVLDANGNEVRPENGPLEVDARGNQKRRYDFSALSPDDYVVSEDGRYVFVKCEVDPNIIFEDKATLFRPRVVITLPAPVFLYRDKEKINNVMFGKLLKGLLDNNGARVFPDDEIKQFLDNMGSNFMQFYDAPQAVMPEFVALPLKSNILSYGPWYAVGAEGTTEYERDESLAPWNYNGFELMNLTAQSKVGNAVSSMTYSETGLITVPGVPAKQLGDILISGGPYVTDVKVAVGTGGVTTTYDMITWTRRFGKLAKAFYDRQARISSTMQQQRRALRQFAKFNRTIKKINKKIIPPVNRRHLPNTPHDIIVAETIDDGKNADMAFGNVEDFAIRLTGDAYTNKAIGTVSTVFRPFSTDPDATNMPKFVTPAAGATTPTVNDLNPFGANHDYPLLGYGDDDEADIEDRDNADGTDKYRTIGLKGPLVIVGPGYDVNGKPVPNATPETPGGDFIENHRQRMDLWPAGPLDTRWDEDRGVWVAGGTSTDIVRGTLLTTTLPGSGTVDGQSNTVLLQGFLNQHLGACLQVGMKYIAYKTPSESRYTIINTDCADV